MQLATKFAMAAYRIPLFLSNAILCLWSNLIAKLSPERTTPRTIFVYDQQRYEVLLGNKTQDRVLKGRTGIRLGWVVYLLIVWHKWPTHYDIDLNATSESPTHVCDDRSMCVSLSVLFVSNDTHNHIRNDESLLLGNGRRIFNLEQIRSRCRSNTKDLIYEHDTLMSHIWSQAHVWHIVIYFFSDAIALQQRVSSLLRRVLKSREQGRRMHKQTNTQTSSLVNLCPAQLPS